MSKLFVSGGKQRTQTLGVKEWSQFEQGVVLMLDAESGELLERHDYSTPAQYLPDSGNPSVLFKSASLVGNRYYACTQTEVIVYELPDFTISAHISLPCFNDVHHVTPTERASLLVVSTGLDLVVEINLSGDIINEWYTFEDANLNRYSKSEDYRKILSTKPHISHPNFVFEYNEAIWVTRFEQKDAICLTGPGKIHIGNANPHDGHVKGHNVYFTTVDGHIVQANLDSRKIERIINIQDYFDGSKSLGWCRGLAPVDKNQFIVGFSRIRASSLHSNLMWAKKWLDQGDQIQSLPTRLVCLNTAQKNLNWQLDLEPHGLNAIFSIHQA